MAPNTIENLFSRKGVSHAPGHELSPLNRVACRGGWAGEFAHSELQVQCGIAHNFVGGAIEGCLFWSVKGSIQVGLEADQIGLPGKGRVCMAEIRGLEHRHGHARCPFHHLRSDVFYKCH
ncbi:hypothetical protein ACA910_004997 [Epithemia clementina (nom. ined.)]